MLSQTNQAVVGCKLNPEICLAAIEELTDDESLLNIAEYAFDDPYICSKAIRRINDQHMLLQIAQNHPYDDCRIVAARRLTNQDSLLEIAEKNNSPEVRIAAVKGLNNQEALATIASDDPNSLVRRAAVSRLMDPRLLARTSINNNMHTIRLAALLHLVKLGYSKPLSPDIVETLMVLLFDRSTVEPVIGLAQQASFAWTSYSSSTTVQALFDAFSEGKGWQASKTIVLAVRELYEARKDLHDVLLSYQWMSPYTNESINFPQERKQ